MNNYEQDEISLIELLEVLLKRKKLIAITTLVFMIGSLAFAFSPLNEKELEFDAVSSIAIIFEYRTPENPEEIGEGFVMYQDRMSNTMLPTIRAYAQSLTLLRGIIADLDLRDNEGELLRARKLAEDIKIENQGGSNLITITVKYNDEELTAAIANLIPQRLIEMAESNENLRDYNIMIIDEAIASEIEQSGGRALILAIGTVLGLMLGVFLAFALEYLNKNVRNNKDVLSYGINIEIEDKKLGSKEFSKSLINYLSLTEGDKFTFMLRDESSLESFKANILDIYQSGIEVKILDFTGNIKDSIDMRKALNLDSKSSIFNYKTLENILETESKNHKTLNILLEDLELFEPLAKLSNSSITLVEIEKTDRKKVEEINKIKVKYNLDIRVALI